MNALTTISGSFPTDEDRRLSALHALNLLDSEPEKAFDALVAIAAQRFDCPISLLSLIDRDRQWIKAKSGIEVEQTDRDIAFCDHTIRSDQPFIINDTSKDPRFAGNPFVTGDAHVRFYAGAPIHVSDADGRHAIGALCIIDDKPRSLNDVQITALTHLALIAEALISARGAAQEALSIAESAQEQSRLLRRQERVFGQAERLSKIGSWRLDLRNDEIVWSDGMYRIHEIAPEHKPDLATALDFYPPRDRAMVSTALDRTIETGEMFNVEVDFVTARGRRRRMRSSGELEIEKGKAVALVGVFQDITDTHHIERKLRESASTDEVTQIANRAEFNRVLEAELQAARAGAGLVLVLIDLDDFKTTNDTFGHLAGDDVLRAVGQRLRAPYLKDSFAARLGGDEFALLLSDPDLVATAPAVIERLLEHLKSPVQTATALLQMSGTIGSASPGPGIDTIRELMHAADVALYTAKRTRRGTAHAFTPPRPVTD
ncbi:sensor domain-containing diguanylate cyclase [Sphingomonas hylomeconis]|uniref:Diguanylate cyclase domain-containing protein n=1 Tax=Sphingomonas hylomeconis TaxID=1395958 RepID=A0ABV7SYH4_9SPHN|nr:sensor domain-containing diguanylate cyclase [Sphingomonas hylomeconis]